MDFTAWSVRKLILKLTLEMCNVHTNRCVCRWLCFGLFSPQPTPLHGQKCLVFILEAKPLEAP